MARLYGGKGAKNFKGTIKKMMKDFKPLLPSLILVSIILIISSALSVITPVFLMNTINAISGEANKVLQEGLLTFDGTFFKLVDGVIAMKWDALSIQFGIIMAFYIIASFITWLAEWIVVKLSATYAYNMRLQIKEKLDKLPLSYFDARTTGDILSRGTNDVDTIANNLSTIVNQTVSGVSLFIEVIIIMFVLSWPLALVVISTLPLSLTVSIVLAKKAQKQYRTYQKTLGAVEGHAEEQYSGFRVVKLFSKEDDSFDEFESLNSKMCSSDWRSRWLSMLIFPTMRFINNIGYVAVCVVGGLIFDASNIGTITVFFLYLQLFQQPFQQLGEIASTMQLVVACAERIYNLLEAEEEPKEDIDCIDTEDNIVGDIDINDVFFSYTKDKKLIQDLNLKVHRGDSVAIVGPTGAGKTTIVNLLMRFYDIDQGEIILDGNDIRHYSRKALRGSVGMVLQDTWLFNGSIKENIRYGRSDATDDDIIEAAKAAHAHHFISTLPGGYDFILNEDGTNISQGQRQLLTIARAIISQPKILILDEATSSVDTRTEMQIQDAMNKMMENKTSFIIAHRLSTIKNAKVILVMNKGEIIEKGSHEELLKLGGFYSELYNAQFSGTNPMAKEE